jgi:sulfatase maturation enzyme AslB (radical SAM superfamily)
MNTDKEFESFEEMQQSDWLKNIDEKFKKDSWPTECVRCKMTEEINNTSIRLDMIERDRILRAIKKNYLIVGGVLDNICNSACQTCSEELSTKIGSLLSKKYKKINNYERFFDLPQDRICELDVNGGEPTASPNYKKLLKNLPSSVKIVRINTNGSKIIEEIEELLYKGIRVIVTLSFDGVGSVHDYVRWPVFWQNFDSNVKKYNKLREKYADLRLNFWTTVSCLNAGDLANIINYGLQQKIDHAYGFCIRPTVLDIRNENNFTISAKEQLSRIDNKLLNSIADKCCSFKTNNDIELKKFISSQDALRGINYKNYFTAALY